VPSARGAIIALGLAALCGAAALLGRGGEARAGDDAGVVHVLAIGVDRYGDAAPVELPEADRDARAVHAFFAEDAASPSTADRATLLAGAFATRAGVLRAIRERLEERATGPRDTAVLYVAAQALSDGKTAFLATRDAQADGLLESALSAGALAEAWARVTAGRKVLLLDARAEADSRGLHFAEVLAALLPGHTPGGGEAEVAGRRGRVAVLLSSSAAGSGAEPAVATATGAFTIALLRGLRGAADVDGDGLVDDEELEEHLSLSLVTGSPRARDAAPLVVVRASDSAPPIVLARPGARDPAGAPSSGPPAVPSRAIDAFVGRLVARRALVAKGGGTAATEAAVQGGLDWLARHQSPDGGWHAEGFRQECGDLARCSGDGYSQFDIGVTGLAVLALLGAGYAPQFDAPISASPSAGAPPLGVVVRKGLRFLAATQDDEGCFGPRTGEFMYNHAVASLAVTEEYGLTRAPRLRRSAQRALDFIAAAQNPYRGWRYSVKPGDNDTSVTGWCVAALKAGELAGLSVSTATAFVGASAWIASVTGDDGEVGYNGKGKVDVIVRGKNEAWGPHPSMTAIGLFSRILMGGGERPRLEAMGDLILRDPPRWEMPAQMRPVDAYYWYHGSLALFQLDGPDGPRWRKWNDPLKRALVAHQATHDEGCAEGSWDPAVDRWGFAGGRVFTTAMNALTLETYYRLAPLRAKPGGK